jgi:hypothetical protein
MVIVFKLNKKFEVIMRGFTLKASPLLADLVFLLLYFGNINLVKR